MNQVVGITERIAKTSQTSKQVSVDRLRIYWDSVGRVIEVCDQAEREDKAWSKARCNGILTDCRKRLCSGLKRLGQSQLTEWEQGFSYVLDDLWHTISPVHTSDPSELIHRIRKARKIAVALEALLAALMSVEPRESMMLKTSAAEPEPKTETTERIEPEEREIQEQVETEVETMMSVKVHLTAYGERDEVRQVQIPTEELVKAGLLKLVFHYGQNEVQPQNHPSVTVGDVVELEAGELFICGFDDWQPVSRETFERYVDQAYCGSEAASIWLYPSMDQPEESTRKASQPVIAETLEEPKPKAKPQSPKVNRSEQAAHFCWEWFKLPRWGQVRWGSETSYNVEN